MTDRAAYLGRFTAEHIAHLCELNHIDTNAVKTKQERISCLCDLPKLVEDEPKNTGVGVDDLLRVMKHLEDSHQHETEKLCKYLLSAAIGSSAQTGPPLKGLHQLSNDDDMVCYLSTFERLALAANKPKSEWPRLLEPYLTGRAQQAFHALSAREQNNYDDVVLAIKRRYHLTPEAYRIKLKKNIRRPMKVMKNLLVIYKTIF